MDQHTGRRARRLFSNIPRGETWCPAIPRDLRDGGTAHPNVESRSARPSAVVALGLGWASDGAPRRDASQRWRPPRDEPPAGSVPVRVRQASHETQVQLGARCGGCAQLRRQPRRSLTVAAECPNKKSQRSELDKQQAWGDALPSALHEVSRTQRRGRAAVCGRRPAAAAAQPARMRRRAHRRCAPQRRRRGVRRAGVGVRLRGARIPRDLAPVATNALTARSGRRAVHATPSWPSAPATRCPTAPTGCAGRRAGLGRRARSLHPTPAATNAAPSDAHPTRAQPCTPARVGVDEQQTPTRCCSRRCLALSSWICCSGRAGDSDRQQAGHTVSVVGKRTKQDVAAIPGWARGERARRAARRRVKASVEWIEL